MAWTERAPSGRFRGRYRDEQDRARTVLGTFASKREALKSAHDAEAKVRGGTWIDPAGGAIRFSTYFETIWILAQTKERSTIASYESAYARHYKPKFGHMRLRDILPSHVQAWLAQLQRDGYAPATVRKLLTQLQAILAGRRGASAVRDGLIATNPCAGVDLPRIPRRTVSIYTPDEVDRLLEAMDSWWRPIPLLATETGMRWGELLGLQVEDFALGMRSVRVNRTIVELSSTRTGNGTPFIAKPYPKSGDERVLAVSPEVGLVIARMISARKLGAGDRLFSMPKRIEWGTRRVTSKRPRRSEVWPNGVPIGRGMFRKQVLDHAAKAAGVEPRRIHDFRATNISWLLSGGMDLPAVMERVGHVQLTTTQRYVAAMNVDQKALEALANVRQRRT